MWDDWIYFGEEPAKEERKIYLNFCLICAHNEDIKGPRYKIFRTREIGLLVEQSWESNCKVCGFPIYTAGKYELLTKNYYVPPYRMHKHQ